jgi:hypothetical protein
MTNKPMKVPGPEHPIDITPTKGRVTVEVNGRCRGATAFREVGERAALRRLFRRHAAGAPR